jgi:hypothetical protein
LAIGVTAHLQVLPEVLVAHRSALLQQLLDLLEHELLPSMAVEW